MRIIIVMVLLLGSLATSIVNSAQTNNARENNGVVNVLSAHDVPTTVKRLERLLEIKGVTIFTIINHSEGAMATGQSLKPTQLVIFGNPKIGTPLMKCQRAAAIDLPQKALIWEDNKGKVWFTYNSPSYLAERHNIQGCDKVLKKTAKVLKMFSSKATGN